MIVKNALIGAIIFSPAIIWAQQPDSTQTVPLREIVVSAIKTVRGTGHMPEVKDAIIYAGKKNEVILIDSLDANKAINNTRQILGRIPGLNIVETESGGFTANGISTRGLNPTQSIEMNTRQNGYNISADINGYNEAYYLPPMEAVSRIEMVRGAASLQFGSQFGGLVNYVIKDAPAHKPLEINISQTAGSFGLFNSFNSIGGTIKQFSYYGFLQFRRMEGWRPNSQQTQWSGYGKLQYKPSEKLTAGVEYSLLRNKVRMPGGLTDSMFRVDPRASFRERNWLKSPWNIVAGYINLKLSDRSSLQLKSSYLFSSRGLVWRNEDGGPGAADVIDPVSGDYVPREVENEKMRSTTTELRFLQDYNLGNMQNTLAAGLRYGHAAFKRQGGGPGTTGFDFDLTVTGPYQYDLDFTSDNLAPFVEHIFRLNERLSVTPGLRFEHIANAAKGYVTEEEQIEADEKSSRNFLLLGIGAEYKTSDNTNIYANFSQAYRPIDYSQLSPFGVTSRIDPNLKDANGYNADLGYRGTVRNYLNFDLGVFYLAYNNRIGVVLLNDPETGEEYSYRTNVANSVHKGIEAYVEFNPIRMALPGAKRGFSIFNSFAYTDARYKNGEFKNNRVETAPKYINRTGLLCYAKSLSATLQMSNVGDAFGDASNLRSSEDPVAGYIPAYTVFDVSATYKMNQYAFVAGINNIGNKAYFTRRTDEYPGPGIIPANGRSFYCGITAVF